MPRYALLTQDACPQCERLKLMLRGPLKGEFDAQIETVHRGADPARFEELTGAHAVQSTPALIDLHGGRVLRAAGSLHEVKAFLQG